MIIPDQSHINRVREALWQLPEGGASIMIGAGFSRNAIKAGPQAREFPLWLETAKALCEKLYPPGDGNRLMGAMAEASGTSGFLRLAQEYEAAFGRGALHNFIQGQVPDDDYVPDDIHVRLLRLPWRDVFTTNWDTLLERTRSLVADRAYGVVHTPEEIPSAAKPRIVKLHGSFPAHVPFIFTEEDYRSYPKRFAPFVNTVQQSMMETVFCLIGFSGDDPNFLHWSGWVRDNLGELAPKIYLAGWLNLSPHRRRMLEERSVVPIDLAGHPQANSWPEHLRHRYATEWIIHTLERGRPYEVTDWPSPPDWRNSSIPELLQPVESVTLNAPIDEPQPPGLGEAASLQDQVRSVVRVWKHNRAVYPGWLFFPPSKHFLVRRFMDDWERVILRTLPALPILERLSVIRELVWRRENLLEPLSEQVEAAAQSILNNIDCQARKIGDVEDRSADWVGIREAWRSVAMALLTAARQRIDLDEFDRLVAALQGFLNDDSDVAQRVNHEKCLWALYAFDFAALEELLKGWRTEGCDPAWMTRKAAILVEMDRNEDAIRLLNRSLSIVRETPRVAGSLTSQSREGWTLWMALAFDHPFLSSTYEAVETPPAFRRWSQLSSLQCDAFDQKQNFLNALRGAPEKKDGPLFDLGARRGRTISFSNAENDRWIASRRVVRLCELAGLPPLASHTVVAKDILAVAADLLLKADYALAARLALRLASSEDDATFNRVWARSRVAAMPIQEAALLVDLVTNVITYALPRVAAHGNRSVFWVERLRVAMEALSRLVLRLPPERAEEIFRRALSYYRMDSVSKDHWLGKCVDHLLARSWEALPNCRRVVLVLDVMSAPILGLDGFLPCNQFYPDPGALLVDDEEVIAPARISETEGRWAEIIHLIVRGLGTGGETRKRAASRLVWLARSGHLTDSEKKFITESLWHESHTDSNALPGGTSLHDWVFLFLPEPEQGLAEQRLRAKWINLQLREDKERINEILFRVGSALANLRQHHRPLNLTSDEQDKIITLIKEWIKIHLISDDHQMRRLGGSFGDNEGITGLQSILPEIDLGSSVAEALFAKATTLNHTNTLGFTLFPGILRSLPSRIGEIAMSMRIGLASDNIATAEDAVIGLHSWLSFSCQGEPSIPSPPGDLMREIGIIIATRRKGLLNRALQAARWVFTYGTSEQREAIAQPVFQGLSYLFEELRYDRDHSEDAELELPLLRWGCAHLALAMSASGYDANSTVRLWAEVAKDDPLPEVRHAERPVAIGSRE